MRSSGHGLRCVRGGREVFSGLDVTADSGQAVAITGTNGAGKTSLLRLGAGLLAMAGGSIGLEGGDGDLTLPEQAHYLGHRDALKPALSVSENLVFWRKFLGGGASRESDADAAQAITTVGRGHVAHAAGAYPSAGQGRARAAAGARGRHVGHDPRPQAR